MIDSVNAGKGEIIGETIDEAIGEAIVTGEIIGEYKCNTNNTTLISDINNIIQNIIHVNII
jgi:hypothetical protein